MTISNTECKQIINTAKIFLENTLYLTVKQEAVNLTKAGIPFLKYLIKPCGIYLSQYKKKRIKQKIKKYTHKLNSNYWSEEEFVNHIMPVLAQKIITKKTFRKSI